MIRKPAKSIFHRCIFTDSSVRNNFMNQGTDNYYIQSFMADIMAAKEVIFGFGFGLALALAFLWTIMMRSRILAHLLVWAGILTVQAALIIVAYLSYTTAQRWSDTNPQTHGKSEILGLQVASIVFLVLGFLFFCFMVFMCRQIELAIQTVGMAARCIDSMPLIVFSPVINTLGFACFLVPWVFYVLFIASSGEYVTRYVGNIAYNKFELSKQTEERLWFLFFCLLWTGEFIGALGQLIIAIASSTWYFSTDASKSLTTSLSVLSAYWTTLRYHMGTAAFGSLTIAVVEFCRAVVLYVQRKLSQSGQVGSFILNYVLCCVGCCLWCIECCLRFISKHAYIQCAIHGESFCSGAKRAFFLLCRNILRIGALSVVSGVLLFMGKVFIAVVAASASYYYLTASYDDQVQGFIAPTILVGSLAWTTASIFMMVFHMTADTLLMCFITDEEMHDGNAKFAEPQLKEFVDSKGGMSQEEFEKRSFRHKKGNTPFAPVATAS